MINYLIGIAILMALIYLVVELTQKPIISIFIKALASLSFIILGMTRLLVGAFSCPTIVGWFLLGLAAGMVGDIILALRPLRPKEEDKLIIVFGIISFSIGHVFYLLGLLTIDNLSPMSLLVGLLVMSIVIMMSYVMKFKMGIARIPSYFYAFLIFLMIGQTIYLSVQYQMASPLLLIVSGALLFGISDLILAPIYYANMKSKWMIALNLITYYGAQILIATSIFYL